MLSGSSHHPVNRFALVTRGDCFRAADPDQVFPKKKIWIEPGRRRIHKRITPSLGGIAIFVGFVISTLLWRHSVAWSSVSILLTVLLFFFILGVSDDLVHVRPRIKLLAQFVAASIAFLFLNVKLNSFYEVWDYQLPEWPSYLLTIFVIIIIINSYNLIDGIDGLAGGIACTSFLAFGIWFYAANNLPYALVCFSMLGAVLGFLVFNWEPSKIFMGDTGSLVIGMLLAITAIEFINTNHNLTDSSVKFSSSILTAICVIIVPVVDTCRIIIVRLSHRSPIFKPDKKHIHHALVRIGLNHAKATGLLLIIQMGFILTAILFREGPKLPFYIIVIAVSVILCVIVDRLISRKVTY